MSKKLTWVRPATLDRMASSTDNNSNSKEQLPSTSSGHDDDQDQGQRLLQESERPTSPAPAPSVLRQWAEGLFSSSPRDWLSPSSCSGCLSQVDDEDGGEGDDVKKYPARSRFDFLDHSERTSPALATERSRLIPIASTESDVTVRTSHRKNEFHSKSDRTLDRTTDGSLDNVEEGVEVEDDIVSYTSCAQNQGKFSLLDDDEGIAARSRDSGQFFRSATAYSTERDIDKSARTSGSNEEEGVEVAADFELGAQKMLDTATTAPPALPFSTSHSNPVSVEVPANKECPLCFNIMSDIDILHPIKCPGKCDYNFCLDCMQSLVRSSKEDYQVASDGSRQLKIWLNCPNCRTGIAGIIEDVIQARQTALASGLESEGKEMPQTSDAIICQSYDPAQEHRLKNRSTAPRPIRQKRIIDLIDTIESMATPSLIRDQVLAAHRQRAHMGFTSSAPLARDSLSKSFTSSEVQAAKPLSSTISSPFYTRSSVPSTAKSKSSTLLSTPSGSNSPERPSPHENKIATANELRRTQSQSHLTPFSPQQLDTKKNSPRSAMDVNYFSMGTSNDKEEVLLQVEKAKPGQPHPSRPHGKKTKGSKVSIEGIDFTEGEGGFFTNTIDLDWCCYDMNSSSVEETPQNVCCEGFVDYNGVHHPCTKLGLGGTGEIVDLQEEPCQGCIFLQGVHDGHEGNENQEEAEEIFYDSDPGQHFAITSWTLSPKGPSSPSRGRIAAEKLGLPQIGASVSSVIFRKRSQLGWGRRKKRRDKSNRGDDANNVTFSNGSSRAQDDGAASPGTPQRRKRRQEDQQAYLYDYFSHNEAMSTGFCSTQEIDARNHVQEALNSKWRLQWHVNIARNSNSPNQRYMPPTVCDLWIERGYRHSRTEIVEPKLMWSQPNLHDKRQMGGSTIRPYRVSLFAVRRIFQITSLEDWEKMNEGSQMKSPPMPIVKPNCLLVVRSSIGADYFFEASCPEERDHIVHLLKMTTARLVSHAVVGNGDMMVREFFNEDFVAGGVNASLISTTNED